MHVRCPHCHNPIEIVDDDPLTAVTCPSCGSNFSLISGEDTVSFHEAEARTIGHFELIERIGVGHFGSVWKANDTTLHRTVAVKIPRNDNLSEEESEIFFREARAAAQLKHPNIVSVYEVGRQNDTIYIVSDFIDGANLKEWIATQRLSSREVAELCVTIAEGLQHAHEAGVIHRDLKPGNIMMDRKGKPYIVDFGLAKRETGEITMTIDGQILGTPAYMPPEQARSEGHHADQRSDVYSLGVILFELLTGELPFRGGKRMLIMQILDDEPPSPRKLENSVPRDLETICLKCLEKDPARRYQTARGLADDLKRYLNSKPILARPIGTTAHVWRWCKREPMIASMTMIIALCLLGGITSSSYFAIRANERAHESAANERLAKQNEQRAKDEAKRADREREKVLAFTRDLLRIELAGDLQGVLADTTGRLRAIGSLVKAFADHGDENITTSDVYFFRTLTLLFALRSISMHEQVLEIQETLRKRIGLPSRLERQSPLKSVQPKNGNTEVSVKKSNAILYELGALPKARTALQSYLQQLNVDIKDDGSDVRYIMRSVTRSIFLMIQTLDFCDLNHESSQSALQEAQHAADQVVEIAENLVEAGDEFFTTADLYQVKANRFLVMAYIDQFQSSSRTEGENLSSNAEATVLAQKAIIEAEAALDGYRDQFRSGLIDDPELPLYFRNLTSTGMLMLEALEIAVLPEEKKSEINQKVERIFVNNVLMLKTYLDNGNTYITTVELATARVFHSLLKLKSNITGNLFSDAEFFEDAETLFDNFYTQNINNPTFWSTKISEAKLAIKESKKATDGYRNKFLGNQIRKEDMPEYFYNLYFSQTVHLKARLKYYQFLYARALAETAVTDR